MGLDIGLHFFSAAPGKILALLGLGKVEGCERRQNIENEWVARKILPGKELEAWRGIVRG
jgi:hypothetical protein